MAPLPNKLEQSQLDEREYVRRCVTRVNTQMKGGPCVLQREEHGGL